MLVVVDQKPKMLHCNSKRPLCCDAIPGHSVVVQHSGFFPQAEDWAILPWYHEAIISVVLHRVILHSVVVQYGKGPFCGSALWAIML